MYVYLLMCFMFLWLPFGEINKQIGGNVTSAGRQVTNLITGRLQELIEA